MRELLLDLHEHGAEASFLLEGRVGRKTFQHLLDHKLIHQYDETPAGTLVVLGPEGRRQLGLHASYRSPPANAADQYCRRRCLEVLEAKGWSYLGHEPSNRNLLRLRRPDGGIGYLLARWRPYPARSVRRVLAGLRRRLVMENAVLLVLTDQPKRLASVIRQSGGLVETFPENQPEFGAGVQQGHHPDP